MELDFTEEVQKNSTLQAHGTMKSDRGIPPLSPFFLGIGSVFPSRLPQKSIPFGEHKKMG